ncbi:MAG: hypothetical protein ACI9BD_000239 [Candidatus Marinamargulisbacteria bacterium]|jgi:hypothetical protein
MNVGSHISSHRKPKFSRSQVLDTFASERQQDRPLIREAASQTMLHLLAKNTVSRRALIININMLLRTCQTPQAKALMIDEFRSILFREKGTIKGIQAPLPRTEFDRLFTPSAHAIKPEADVSLTGLHRLNIYWKDGFGRRSEAIAINILPLIEEDADGALSETCKVLIKRALDAKWIASNKKTFGRKKSYKEVVLMAIRYSVPPQGRNSRGGTARQGFLLREFLKSEVINPNPPVKDIGNAMIFSDGTVLKGTLKNGQINGHGTEIHSGGTMAEGQFKNGLKNGNVSIRFPNGDVQRELWFNGHEKETQKRPSPIAWMDSISNTRASSSPYNPALALNGFKDQLEICAIKSDFTPCQKRVLERTKNDLNNLFPSEEFDDNQKIESLAVRSRTAPQVIAGGWKNHSVVFVIFQDNLLIFNKERGALELRRDGRCKPILHLEFDRESLPNILRLIHIATEKNFRNGRRLIYGDIPSAKGVKEAGSGLFRGFISTEKKGKNCGYNSSHVATYGIMVMHSQKVLAERGLNSSSRKSDKEVINLARGIYKRTLSFRATLPKAAAEYVKFKKSIDSTYDSKKDPALNVPKMRKLKNMGKPVLVPQSKMDKIAHPRVIS